MKLCYELVEFNDGVCIKGNIEDVSNSEVHKASVLIDDRTAHIQKVRGGRKKLHKGTSEQVDVIENSIYLSKLVSLINNEEFAKELLSRLGVDKVNGRSIDRLKFSTNRTQSQVKIMRMFRRIFSPSTLYWEYDFSCSTSGYARGPHLDSPHRIAALLVYLTDVDINEGGEFLFHGKPETFDSNRDCVVTGKGLGFKPSRNLVLGFLSSDNSCHQATIFRSDNNQRVFCYFGLTVDQPVIWN